MRQRGLRNYLQALFHGGYGFGDGLRGYFNAIDFDDPETGLARCSR